MDRAIETIAAFGIPGLVLLVAIHLVGLAGGAAIVAALAALGGPLGMLGGIALLILISQIARWIAEYGAERLGRGVIRKLQDTGKTLEDILRAIEGYPISRSLKEKLKAYIRKIWDQGLSGPDSQSA